MDNESAVKSVGQGNRAGEGIQTPTSFTPSEEDPFNLDKLRLSQDFASAIGVKKHILTVPVRKPGRQDFVRVYPGEDWRLQTAVLELKEERETYLVDQSLRSELSIEITPKVLFTTINRQGVVFLWPIRLPGDDGRVDEWNLSALKAAQMAMDGWVRVAANMSLGAYDVYEAAGDIPNPTWPDVTFNDLVRIAFKDKFIRDHSHPVLLRLQGLQ